MTQQPDTIVLINGLSMTALSWENWVKRYTDKGYRVIAKSWPGMEGDIDALRRDPSAIATVGVGDIVEHYEGIIGELDSQLVIIGHSFGGRTGEFQSARGDRGELSQRRPRTAAADFRRPRPHFSPVRRRSELQAVPEIEGDHRVQAFPRAHALYSRTGWLGRCCRLRAGLGRGSRFEN